MEAMKGPWVLLFLLALASAAHIKLPRENYADGDSRISYGYDADITEAKFYAFLQCGNALCGATLVAMNRLITAAHCVADCNPQDSYFVMGMNSRTEINEGKGDRYGITEIHVYPGYKENRDFNYDIAVLYVDGEVTSTDKVDRIPYALEPTPLNDYITCFGYGTTETGQGSEKLQKTWLLTKRHEGNMLFSNAEQTSVLPGDSGGPCIYNNYFIGDISGLVYVNGKTYENIVVMTSAPEILTFLRSRGL